METLLRLQFNSNTMLDLHLMNYIGKKIYILPHRLVLDTKSREFQYKRLNRCLDTNVLLNKIKKKIHLQLEVLFLWRSRIIF